MEDTLGGLLGSSAGYVGYVLILVLMEDTLGEEQTPTSVGDKLSLNPCFNGRYSRRV